LPILRAAVDTEKKPDDKKKEKILEDMKKGGLDKATAQKVLKRWEETGATDADTLNKMLRRRSLGTVITIIVQAVLDAGASYGAFNLAAFLAAADKIPLHWVLSFGANFLGSYFAIGVFFDLFTLGAVTVSSLQFQTNSAAFLSAVQEIAGQDTGLNVIDKATQAANTLKVFNALNAISDMLQEEASKGGQGGTLSDLSAYLLLTQAKDKYGFDYEQEGLSSEEAGTIANLFARFDLNDDGRLDLFELNKLATELNSGLSEAEVKEGFRMLDKDDSRFLEFPEFVAFYKKQIKEPATA